jgi:hypothetical protein
MTAVDNLRPDLACRLSLSYLAEIGRTISANSKDRMTALASFTLKDYGATLPLICICGVYGMIGQGRGQNSYGKKDSTGAERASR